MRRGKDGEGSGGQARRGEEKGRGGEKGHARDAIVRARGEGGGDGGHVARARVGGDEALDEAVRDEGRGVLVEEEVVEEGVGLVLRVACLQAARRAQTAQLSAIGVCGGGVRVDAGGVEKGEQEEWDESMGGRGCGRQSERRGSLRRAR